jgi:PadR family transcriptional regulator AphA
VLPTCPQCRYTHWVSTSPTQRGHSGTLSPEFALLGLLFAGPSHGYDLHQKFLSELGYVWHLSQSQAYSILKRLEARGDISARAVKQHRLPSRQELQITGAGRRRFLTWLEKGCGTNARSIRLEFLTRLYFARLLKPDQAAVIFHSQVEVLEDGIHRLERALQALPGGQTYNQLSLDLRLRQMQLIRQWMREIGRKFRISSPRKA